MVGKTMIRLWSRAAGTDGLYRWAPDHVIDLSTVRNANPYPYYVVDILHSLGAIIIWAHDGVFSVDMDSNRVTKLCEDKYNSYSVPYMSFCMPGTDTNLICLLVSLLPLL